MIHDFDVGPTGAGPTVRLCNLIISECLTGGHTSIRLTEGEAVEGEETIAVQYLVEGDWKEVMRIPSQAGVQILAHLRSLCDVGPTRDPNQEASFRVCTGGYEVSVAASFVKVDSGGEEVELRLTPHPPVDV